MLHSQHKLPGISRSPWGGRCRTDGRSVISSLIHGCYVPGPWNSTLPHQEQNNTKQATKTSGRACLKVGGVGIKIWWGCSIVAFAFCKRLAWLWMWGVGTHTWKEMRIPRFLDTRPASKHFPSTISWPRLVIQLRFVHLAFLWDTHSRLLVPQVS